MKRKTIEKTISLLLMFILSASSIYACDKDIPVVRSTTTITVSNSNADIGINE